MATVAMTSLWGMSSSTGDVYPYQQMANVNAQQYYSMIQNQNYKYGTMQDLAERLATPAPEKKLSRLLLLK
jgi:hypothetical protein